MRPLRTLYLYSASYYYPMQFTTRNYLYHVCVSAIFDVNTIII